MLRRTLLGSLKRTYAKDLQTEAEITKKVAIEKFQQKAIRVAVLGTSTPIGESLSVLLKENPLVSHLYLHGDSAKGVAADLAHIDTRTMVSGFYEDDVDKAVRSAQVIVILPLNKYGDSVQTPIEKFRHEYERLIKLTRSCTMYAPKSIIYVCVPPISMSVPLVAGIYKKTHWYHPGRIIGSVAFHQVRLNTIFAFHNNLDPCGVHVPIAGGPDIDCVVPLFSRATPIGSDEYQSELLTKIYKNIPQEEPVTMVKKKLEFLECASLAQAYAVNRSLTTIALGLLGDQEANMSAFMRSNILPTCKHLASTVRIGPSGVVHNYGIPILTYLELDLIEQATLLLDQREKEALTMLEAVDEKRVALKAN